MILLMNSLDLEVLQLRQTYLTKNDIGGHAFMIKLRETAQPTPMSIGIELPFALALNAAEDIDFILNPRRRHMKCAF